MKGFGGFIVKNFVMILGFYLFAMAACGTGLVLNNAPASRASNGGGAVSPANPTVNIALWSVMAAFTAVTITAVILFLVARKRNNDTTV